MTTIIRTGFQTVFPNIQFQPQTVSKGKLLVLAHHVRNIEELRCNKLSYCIRADVVRQTSVTLPPYKTSLNINNAREVTAVKCTCVYNQSGKCKHVAALIYFINNDESQTQTSQEQQWGKPSTRQFVKQKYAKGKFFHEMFPPTKKVRRDPEQVHLSELVHVSSLRTVLEAAAVSKDMVAVKDTLKMLLNKVETNLEQEECEACINSFFIFRDEFEVYQSNYELEDHLREFYNKNIVMSNETIRNVCQETIKQSMCSMWYAIRRFRISASTNVHSIKSRTRKSIDSLVNSILFPKKVDCEATRYGLNNEECALAEYEKINNCQVKRVGVIISKHQPWLCTSVDGVVVEDCCITKLVEIKCPISCKTKSVINENTNSCNVAYLELHNGELTIKKSTMYYTQIQVQMYITGMTVCDLFVYSPVENGSVTVRMYRDEPFIKEVIIASELFYFKHYLPAVYIAATKDQTNDEKRSFTGQNILNLIKEASRRAGPYFHCNLWPATIGVPVLLTY